MSITEWRNGLSTAKALLVKADLQMGDTGNGDHERDLCYGVLEDARLKLDDLMRIIDDWEAGPSANGPSTTSQPSPTPQRNPS